MSFYFFKSTGAVFNFLSSNLSTFVFKLFKIVGTLVSLLISSLSTSALKAKKPFLAVKSNVSMLLACFGFLVA